MNSDYNRDSWANRTRKSRCRTIGAVAAQIVQHADQLLAACRSDQRTDDVQTITAELLPLCGALKFIGKRGPKILADRQHGFWGRAMWMWGVRSKVRRDPFGTVLILGTWNYKLLLTGSQAAQALAAGNRVLLKPAVGSELATQVMIQAFHEAGVPPEQLQQIDSSTESAIAAMDAGVDLIVLTGSAGTGRAVLKKAADSLTPTIMELSGCDAVVVSNDADLDRTADSIDFALTLNGGATCIGPRRLIAEPATANELMKKLEAKLSARSHETVHEVARASTADTLSAAIQSGAVDCLGHFEEAVLRDQGLLKPVLLDNVQPQNPIAAADIFAPVASMIRVEQIEESVRLVNQCPYRLAASIFASDKTAKRLASQFNVGSISINDLVVPTADPRLPFGGRGDSGFGVTRGAEGLLAMTSPTVVSTRRGNFVPHLHPELASDPQTLIGALQLLYADSFSKRFGGVKHLITSLRKSPADEENHS